MAKRNRLESTDEVSGTLIGIVTTNRDYRLVHFINQSLGISLVSEEDIPVYQEKSAELHLYPFFMFHHADLRTGFFLIANYNGKVHMIPSLRQIHFFLLLQGAAYKQHIEKIISGLRSTEGVQAAIPVPMKSLKETVGILEDLEIHVLNLKKTRDRNTPPLNLQVEK